MKAIAIIRQNVIGAFIRFPVAFVASALCFLFAVFEFKESFSLYAALTCTCFWAISATLFVESRNAHKVFAMLAGLAGGVAFFLIVDNVPDPQWVGFMVVLACVASMKAAPFLHRDGDAESMGFFCCSIARTIAFTIMVTFVLFIGGAAILLSLHYLLGVPFPPEVYVKFWLFCGIFFAPVFAMGELPRDFSQKIETYTRQQRIIIVNLLLPLMLVYAVILWLYIAKIIVLMELPKGGVAYLVTAFSLGSMVLYFFSVLQASAPYALMRLWRRFFPLVLSAPLALLVIGIATRIHAYGVTEDRYAVALLAAWLVGAVVWIAVNRRNTQKLIWIYASGIGLVFLASFGPWSAASISQWSQVSRLEGILQEHELLNAQRHITKQGKDVPKSAVVEISSIVNYLAKTKKITAIRPWFAELPDAHIHKEIKYFSAHEVMKDMGLQYLYSYNSPLQEDNSKKIRFHHTNDPTLSSSVPFAIGGYDRMIRTRFMSGKAETAKAKLGEEFEAEFDNIRMRIIITSKDGKVIVFPLSDVIAALKENTPKAEKIANIPVIAETPSLHARLYITNISGYFDEENIVHIENINIILLYQHR